MEKKEQQIDKALTVRERMTIQLLLLIVKIVKPFNWIHELDKALEEFNKEMKNELKLK